MAEAVSANPLRERELLVDGVRTRLLEAGSESDSEAVVFVHGNPNSAVEWSDLLARTGEFARAVALDMPGFGTAEAPSDLAYPVEGYVRFSARRSSSSGSSAPTWCCTTSAARGDSAGRSRIPTTSPASS
jgi:pimeloyl-ACP methyl ester carboxylesterase